jgi:hypothetical protein
MEQIREWAAATEDEAGRRAKVRYDYGTCGRLISEEESASDPVYITINDVSAGGVGFFASHQVEKGSRILITLETDFGDLEISGVVAHCTPTVGGYRAGVSFELD